MIQDSTQMLNEILVRLRQVIGPAGDGIPLHAPEFSGDERALVLDCIDTAWVSSVGKYVDAFEAEVARACGTAYGVAVVNGTAALQVALEVSGVRPGDEVLIPALTFIATANAVHHLGAIPHFVDSEDRTLGIDATALAVYLRKIGVMRPEGLINRETGRHITALVPMHVFGIPSEIYQLQTVAEEFGLVLVEDAAEALGSSYNGRPCGSFGKTAALSFNGNKIITTGGGGAIVTDNVQIARRAKHLTTTAKIPHRWAFVHDEVGYNYRLPNLNAALGVAQFAQLENRLSRKRVLAQRYYDAFDGFQDASILRTPQSTESNYWLNTLLLEKSDLALRDALLEGLNAAGYMARPAWTLMDRLAIHASCPRAPLPVAEDLERRIINLPSSACLVGQT